MTKLVYWRQVFLSSFRYSGPYFYQTMLQNTGGHNAQLLKGPFWGYWRRTQKLRGGNVFLHCELMRSNPVLVFEVVVDFLIFVSHLILNILNMREEGTGPVSSASIKPSSYSSSSVGRSSSMSRSSPGMLRFWVTDAIKDTGLLSSSISAGSSFTWTWCLKQK